MEREGGEAEKKVKRKSRAKRKKERKKEAEKDEKELAKRKKEQKRLGIYIISMKMVDVEPQRRSSENRVCLIRRVCEEDVEPIHQERD